RRGDRATELPRGGERGGPSAGPRLRDAAERRRGPGGPPSRRGHDPPPADPRDHAHRAARRAGHPSRPDGHRAVLAALTDPPERQPVKTSTRVVIAEDEAIIRLDLKELLEEEGYEVVGETGRGDEAVDLVRDLDPDLAILDIKMPGMDGLTAARHIA